MKLSIVGHGNFPSGIKSAVELLVGNIEFNAFDLDENTNHAEFEKKFKQYVEQNNNDVHIVFADLTGGAPHQIVGNILNSGDLKWILVSGVSLPIVVETMLLVNDNTDKPLNVIKGIVETAKNTILCLESKK